MIRSVLSAIALAAIFATMRPAIADPLEAIMCDHPQPAAAATQQTAPVPASTAASDTTAPPGAKEYSPVGFGWG
jgi:hypothetical protein